MLNLEFSIASIATFVGILDQITKTTFKTCGKNTWDKYIPICSLVYGLALGIAGYFIPTVEMGNNIIEAIFIGLSAGAAATGVHQIYHQQTKEEKSDTPKTETTETTEPEEEVNDENATDSDVTTVEETIIVNDDTTEEK